MEAAEVLKHLESLGRPSIVAGMERFGVTSEKAFGVSAPQIRALAKEIGMDQKLSLELWDSEYLEARALASLIGDPAKVTEAQMERWVKDFDSWAVCDTCCGNLFDRTAIAYRKALEWSKRDKEFVKRAGFVLMATLAVHDKGAEDEAFVRMLPSIVLAASDDRNFVKKAVNWALRQIGKRNKKLNALAIKAAVKIRKTGSSSARWIAADALRELRSKNVQRRLASRQRKQGGQHERRKP
jgi:3-methyladenine DNA glycosylase AlkD